MQQFAVESTKGFGLGPEYWSGRVAEVQKLLEAVQKLAAGESPEKVKQDLENFKQERPVLTLALSRIRKPRPMARR